MRINSGGGALTDAGGRTWRADSFVTGGSTWDSGRLVDSTTPEVDRSERVGDSRYAIPVPTAGDYVLRVHLTENYWSSVGQRVFDIAAEGSNVATGVDILATHRKHQTRLVDARRTVTDGHLTVDFKTLRNKASVTAIEVFHVAPPTTAPVVAPVAAGTPTTSARGSFVERAYGRTYSLTGMQVGTSGDAVANGSRLRAVLAAAQPGDLITVAPGHYRLAGNIEFTVPNVTLKGMGTDREQVWFEHTTETRALFMVKAGGVHFYNFTHRVHGTARSSLGQSGEGNIWVQGGHSGFRMQDVLAWGSRDAAVFLYGVHGFELNRVESRDSMSDCYHVSNGSSYGTWYDSKSTRCGDDGIGFVGYGGEGPGTPHHHTVVRHHVAKQGPNGRGIGIIHVNNIDIHGPTLIEDSWGAGIILARESQYGSGGIRAIRIYGELRFRRANSAPGIVHGAIHINNPDTVAPIEDVLITGPVIAVDTGINRGGVPFQVRAHGAGRIQAEIRDMRFYGTGPSTKLSLSLASGSSVTTPGWSNATPYSAGEPAFPLG
jgi:hypothetical protein